MMKRGITLIEILLVVAILLVLTAGAAPFYSQYLTKNDLSLTADQICGQLRKAQNYTVSGRRNSNWGVRWVDNRVVLFAGDSFASRNQALDENWSVNPNFSITGFDEVVYTGPRGVGSTNYLIVISFQGKEERIAVNQEGMVERL